MIDKIIPRYVKELAEEAQAQIEVKAANIESVEFPCTEDDYVKLAVEATLMKDPIEALTAVLEAHAWVMTRETLKEYGIDTVRLLLIEPFGANEEILERSCNLWNETKIEIQIKQNHKLVNMIIGETNGKS